jgi:hypothetical protein
MLPPVANAKSVSEDRIKVHSSEEERRCSKDVKVSIGETGEFGVAFRGTRGVSGSTKGVSRGDEKVGGRQQNQQKSGAQGPFNTKDSQTRSLFQVNASAQIILVTHCSVWPSQPTNSGRDFGSCRKPGRDRYR